MKVAILGYGTVGSAVVKFLLENDKLIRARCGQSITPVIALARSPKNALIPITHSVAEILNADVDVFVELMGGVDEAFKIVSEILKRKSCCYCK